MFQHEIKQHSILGVSGWSTSLLSTGTSGAPASSEALVPSGFIQEPEKQECGWLNSSHTMDQAGCKLVGCSCQDQDMGSILVDSNDKQILNFFMLYSLKTGWFFYTTVPPKEPAMTQFNYYLLLEVLPKLCALNTNSEGKKVN